MNNRKVLRTNFKISIFLIILLGFLDNCAPEPKLIRDFKDVEDGAFPTKQDSAKTEQRLQRQSLSEWNSSKEGFLDSSTFQVKVSSLKTSRQEALEEATEVAKRKILRMLVAEASPTMSPEGKIDLRILIEEYGRILSDTDFSGEKFHFIYQIKRPALEIIVREKIK
jgi:hypothetical protein